MWVLTVRVKGHRIYEIMEVNVCTFTLEKAIFEAKRFVRFKYKNVEHPIAIEVIDAESY